MGSRLLNENEKKVLSPALYETIKLNSIEK